MAKIINARIYEQNVITLDQKGYFIIKANKEEMMIHAEYRNYEHELVMTIKGEDARNIYFSILEQDLISSLEHAAYLGKELTRGRICYEV